MTIAEAITKLAELGAGEEALEWLATQPSIEAAWAAAPFDYIEWVCDELGIAPPHWDAYQAAIAPHWDAYEAAIAPHRKAYEDAIAPHRKAYEDAIAPHQKAYEDAIAPHQKAYEAALRAQCNQAASLLIEVDGSNE